MKAYNNKEKILKLLEKLPERELAEVIDFLEYLNFKKDKHVFKDLMLASESSMDFWYNEEDDKNWNDL
jgi:hypothetical protein